MIWSFIHQKIKENIELVLLCVLESSGSSPGRQGFKMAVASDGTMRGSIGGGIMEQKLVVLAQKILAEKQATTFLKKQIHRKDSPTDRSGMICSGAQTVFLYPIQTTDFPIIERLAKGEQRNAVGSLQLGPRGMTWRLDVPKNDQAIVYHFEDHNHWSYLENLVNQAVIYIVGAGHVGWALSRQMAQLGFYVKLLDDRSGLNTFEQNRAAQEKHIVDYQTIGTHILEHPKHFVVIMSFGYRSDKIILQQLLGKTFGYLGMMGSDAKIKQLFEELLEEGHQQSELDQVKAPIGLPIYSKTPEEIAVSIAAEIIQVKNKNLPTGRKQESK